MIAVNLTQVKALLGDERGSALVEGAVVVPFLIVFFLGAFEFSWYFYNQQLVVAGLRDAARYMTRVQLTDGNMDPCVQKDLRGVLYSIDAANLATTAQVAPGGVARVRGWRPVDVTISCVSTAALESGAYSDGSTSMTIVRATTTFSDPSLGFFSALGLTTPPLSFAHQERFLGPG
jgi:Flp pilus assembly protein TadG